MPYKSTAPLEAQSSKWRKSRTSLLTITQAPARALKRHAEELGIESDDERRKRARVGEEFEMDVDVNEVLVSSEMDLVDMEEETCVALDGYPRPFLGSAINTDPALGDRAGLSRYGIDVECIIRQGFGDGSDETIAVELYRQFRPCGNIRDITFEQRFGASILIARIVFEDERSVTRALELGLSELGYQVGDSMRRLWVNRATYTSRECTIIPESQAINAEAEASRSRSSSLLNMYRTHPDLRILSDEHMLPEIPLPPCIPMTDLPPKSWPTPPSTAPFPLTPRRSLQSQNEAFDASGFKRTRD